MKKIISRSTLLLLLSIPMFSFADTTLWIADKRGCKVVNISPQEGESITWSGECKNGLANGGWRFMEQEGDYNTVVAVGRKAGRFGQAMTPLNL